MSGLKSNAEWEDMDYAERAEWLSLLLPRELHAQARIRATASACSVEKILSAWVQNGYISRATMRAALAAASA